MPSEDAFDRLFADRFEALPADCGNETVPGIDESPAHRDWSARPTTRDQKRMEEFIAPRLTKRSCILHVGIGNSGLASRFCQHVERIEGLTISRAEQAHALSLNLPGYYVRLINKYSAEFAAMTGRFEFILDNNPSSFACCLQHFRRMMLAYRARLAPGGMLISDLSGLAHLASDAPNLRRWSLSMADWQAMAQGLGMEAGGDGEQVVWMRAER